MVKYLRSGVVLDDFQSRAARSGIEKKAYEAFAKMVVLGTPRIEDDIEILYGVGKDSHGELMQRDRTADSLSMQLSYLFRLVEHRIQKNEMPADEGREIAQTVSELKKLSRKQEESKRFGPMSVLTAKIADAETLLHYEDFLKLSQTYMETLEESRKKMKLVSGSISPTSVISIFSSNNGSGRLAEFLEAPNSELSGMDEVQYILLYEYSARYYADSTTLIENILREKEESLGTDAGEKNPRLAEHRKERLAELAKRRSTNKLRVLREIKDYLSFLDGLGIDLKEELKAAESLMQTAKPEEQAMQENKENAKRKLEEMKAGGKMRPEICDVICQNIDFYKDWLRVSAALYGGGDIEVVG